MLKWTDHALARGVACFDGIFFRRVRQAVARIASRKEMGFVRIALKEKIDGIHKAARREYVSRIASLLLTAAYFLAPEYFRVAFTVLLASILCYFTVGLVRAEEPEEQARAQRVLAGVVLGGAVMALAKPIAYWVTGIRYDEAAGTWYVGGKPADLPPELISMIDRLLMLIQVIGVVVIIGGAIYCGIQLARTEKKRS